MSAELHVRLVHQDGTLLLDLTAESDDVWTLRGLLPQLGQPLADALECMECDKRQVDTTDRETR